MSALGSTASRPGFGGALLIAGITTGLAAGIGIVFALPGFSVSSEAFLALAVPLLSASYLIWLLRQTSVVTGRVTVAAFWAVTTAVVAWIDPSTLALLVIYSLLIWLVRSVYFYRSVATALVDLLICAASMVAAIWAAKATGSFVLTTWTFFLAQSAFVFVPRDLSAARDSHDADHREVDTEFQAAERRAEQALRTLYRRNQV